MDRNKKKNIKKKNDTKHFPKAMDTLHPKQENIEYAFSEKKLNKYLRGKRTKLRDVKLRSARCAIRAKEEKILEGAKLAAHRENYLLESDGFLVADDGESTLQFNQTDLVNSVDALSASKRFDLELRDFGPYRINYIRNGRHLVMGGKRGHIAAFDWITKKLQCEMNVMEEVCDVAWLHQETLFAAAQKKWVHIYDNQGMEIHCLKTLDNVVKLEFLPYHFLLSTYSSTGFLSWLDVSIGKMVAQFRVNSRGTAPTIAQNPANAHTCIGEPNGIVTFWSPNSQKPVVSKWCHKQPISAIAFDPKGQIFATSSVDKTLKFWDARNLQGPMEDYLLRSATRSMAFSQKDLLALAFGNIIEVRMEGKPYLRHTSSGSISNIQFCPFEDVLGIGHSSGLSSILVPGSAEPNIDALEINPYRTKSQRRESEVKSLLDKIPADLITWDPNELQTVHIPSLESILEKKKKLLHVKKPDIQYTPKKKTGKAAKTTLKRKMIVRDGMRKRYFEKVKEMQEKELQVAEIEEEQTGPPSVLDRFKPKSKKPK